MLERKDPLAGRRGEAVGSDYWTDGTPSIKTPQALTHGAITLDVCGRETVFDIRKGGRVLPLLSVEDIASIHKLTGDLLERLRRKGGAA